MTAFVLSQIIAFGALFCAVWSFQLKRREHIISIFIVMSLLSALHFYVLGQYAAAALGGVSLVRYVTSMFFKNTPVMYGFIALTVLVGWMQYEAWFNAIVAAAGVFGVIATFQASDRRFREIMVISNTLMIVHNAIVFTPVGLMIDVILLVSNAIGYYRYYGLAPFTFRLRPPTTTV